MKTRREVALERYPKLMTSPDNAEMMCAGDVFYGLPQSFDDVCPLTNNHDLDGCEKCWSAAYAGEELRNIWWLSE